jgi:hypothetical protein
MKRLPDLMPYALDFNCEKVNSRVMPEKLGELSDGEPRRRGTKRRSR